MKKRLALLLPLSVLIAGFAVGCGSSSDDSSSSDSAPTKAAYIKQADKICSDGSAELSKEAATAFSNPSQPTQAEAEKFTSDTLVPNLEGQIDDLRALTPPSGDEDTTAKIFDTLEDGVNSVSDDPSKLNGAFTEASKLAGDYGMAACAAQ